MISKEDFEAMMSRLMKEIRRDKNSSETPRSTPETTTMNLLMRQIPEFRYDPEDGLTFDLWFNRYESVLEKEGAALDDTAKVRFIVQKLDQDAFQKYDAHILPKKYSDLNFADTISKLKELFGHRGSEFARRYQYFQSKCENTSGGTFDDYTGLVNKRHELSNMSKITADQMKCLVWICGLKGSEHNDVRELALQFIEDKPESTLSQLHQHSAEAARLVLESLSAVATRDSVRASSGIELSGIELSDIDLSSIELSGIALSRHRVVDIELSDIDLSSIELSVFVLR
ncbi:uncharacterized protein LOC108865058 [Galendromus occidentalis]|uniref:Uncharacterized protein LOC108865058 n=1 Tax=Galendromus occidentalis TaxID=34638 RepID=A0AAJ7L6D3_9ACAR|nr:uncharacterized protein LOC108865058 [Galendromus occidentalis]